MDMTDPYPPQTCKAGNTYFEKLINNPDYLVNNKHTNWGMVVDIAPGHEGGHNGNIKNKWDATHCTGVIISQEL